MYITNYKKEECTGCAACMNICRSGAIYMAADKGGFLYPVIDTERCNGCGRCAKVCEGMPGKDYTSIVYAMQSRDNSIRLHSTSGGIFSEFAQYILRRGGGVAGAAYQADWSAKHRLVWNLEDLELIRRSKYQQSEMGYLYRKIELALQKKNEILFCGTPCQVSGLKQYLGKEYETLFTCDFICRGVSSPKVFAKYIEDLKQSYKSDIKFIWMKHKCNGWHSLTTVIGFENGMKYVRKGLEDSYLQLYLKYNTGVRESCYTCKFKGNNSLADVTLGDFWGLEGNEMDDNIGTSAVICRTLKGKKMIDEIKPNVLYQKMSLEQVRNGNPCFYKSLEKKGIDVEEFYLVLENEGYQKTIKWAEEYILKTREAK